MRKKSYIWVNIVIYIYGASNPYFCDRMAQVVLGAGV